MSITTNNILTKYNFQIPKDITDIVSIPNERERVESIEKVYYQINVSDAMHQLSNVGNLLQIAYAGTKGFSSNSKVIAIISEYQSLIKDSSVATGGFVQSSLQALEHHKETHNLAIDHEFEDAMEIFLECSSLAGDMAKASDELAKSAENLCQLSKQALVKATEDESFSEQERKQILERIHNVNATQASLKSQSESLDEEITEEKAKEVKAAKKADTAQQQAFVLGVLGSITKPVVAIGEGAVKIATSIAKSLAVSDDEENSNSNKEAAGKLVEKAFKNSAKASEELIKNQEALNKAEQFLKEEKEKGNKADQTVIEKLTEEVNGLNLQVNSQNKIAEHAQNALKEIQKGLKEKAESYEEKESRIAEKRAKLQAEKRKINAELAESVERLKNFNLVKNDLETSVASLEIAVQTLGKVKTVFEDARKFWKGVENQCNSLSKIKLNTFAKEKFLKKFTEKLVASAWNWAVLGKISLEANNSISLVEGKVDHNMNNLPSKAEASNLIKDLVEDIKDQIKKENAITM